MINYNFNVQQDLAIKLLQSKENVALFLKVILYSFIFIINFPSAAFSLKSTQDNVRQDLDENTASILNSCLQII